MQRTKQFNATGVAPNGRLYAGDLLAIMDAAAGLSDFTQTVDVNVARIGDSSIQLLKYGTAEARISAALRVDGILRGTGGLFAGNFTTSARNAIASGSRPTGLIIWNTSTSQFEYNAGSDASPNWQPMVSSGISDGSVTEPKLANDAVSNRTIADNAVTANEIAADAVGTSEIAPNAVGASELADNAVDTAAVADGAITFPKLASGIAGFFPIGAYFDWPWAAGSIPSWTVLPYGQLLSRATYAALNSLASADSYRYGAGDGSTTFGIIDLRGRVGAGMDNMGGTAASRITVAVSGIDGTTLGAAGGLQGVTLVTGNMPAHNHGGGNHGHQFDYHSNANETGGNRVLVAKTDGVSGINTNSATHPPMYLSGTILNTEGSGTAHQNVQPTIIVNKAMRVL